MEVPSVGGKEGEGRNEKRKSVPAALLPFPRKSSIEVEACIKLAVVRATTTSESSPGSSTTWARTVELVDEFLAGEEVGRSRRRVTLSRVSRSSS